LLSIFLKTYTINLIEKVVLLYMEHRKRSVIKALTWRVIAFLVTIIAVYIYSRDIKEALVIGVSANFVKIFLYYIHERIWNRVKFGRVKIPEYQI